MKKLITSFLLLLCTNLIAATGPDDILGIWLSSSGNGQVQIYKEGNKYFGKLNWMKEPNNAKGNPKMDSNNPDPAQRNKPLLGSVILRDFTYHDGEWNGGRIYDPQNGKDYKCIIKLKDPNTLSLRGYIGISLLGRTEVWTRVK
jgi:uncharacterized protein (DUF2147 family)